MQPTPTPDLRISADRLYWFGREHTGWHIVHFIACHRMRRHTPIRPHRLNAWELAVVESGELHLVVRGKALRIPARHCGIIPPHAVISSAGPPNAGTVYWVGLRLVDIPEQLRKPLRELQKHLRAHAGQSLPASDAFIESARELFERAQQQEPLLDRHAAALEMVAKLVQMFASPSSVTAPATEEALITPAVQMLKAGPPEGIAVSELARACHMSRTTFTAMFKRVTGMPPRTWMNRRRIELAAAALRGSNKSIETIAVSLGFPSAQYFATVFKTVMGTSPSQYRSGPTVQSP